MELGKVDSGQRQPRNQRLVAMEPSFWSWEKHLIHRRPPAGRDPSQWSPAFGAGKSRQCGSMTSMRRSRRNGAQLLELGKGAPIPAPTHQPNIVAMEPSFWSWEKIVSSPLPSSGHSRRNGAQLLELGKVFSLGRKGKRSTCRNGAQLLELGKAAADFCMRPR